jgi:putative N6-adenine-specific DNA methylase
MNHLTLFLPCASGVEPYLVQEAALILGRKDGIHAQSAGVQIQGSWRDSLLLNLHSRLASRVLIQVQGGNYRSEQDIYQAACDVAWEIWFTQRHTFKIDITATRSPLQSLNFAALRVKDAICDRFRHLTGERPSVDVQNPDARIYVHLGADELFLYVDTSGEPLFKRGWRQEKGDAPLKETLAAAMLAASGWWNLEGNERELQPLYDPCCGSGTIAIEAAQIALGIPAGSQRRFGFERLIPFQSHVWNAMKSGAVTAVSTGEKGQKVLKNPLIYGSDVAHRMVDFAQRNAELAGVSEVIEFRGGDALQRNPPCELPPQGAVILTNPPYGERIEVAGFAGRPSSEQSHPRARSRETAIVNQEEGATDSDFFPQLAAHWKTHFDGWTAWLLVPDMKLPGKMRLKETRRVPLWNGPIECRLFRFDIQGRRNPQT